MGVSLARSADVEMTHVSCKGGPPIVQDLLAGQIAAGVVVVSNVLPHIQSGKLRALATTAPKRASILPDVPTAREAGYPALEGVEWFGLLVPAGTSPEIVSGLNSAVGRTLDVDAFKAKLAEQSFEPQGCTPAEFAQLIKSDLKQWAATVKAFGFRPMD
jgi:tripartite-type tricarboxylate transporter receptor subunit TctC